MNYSTAACYAALQVNNNESIDKAFGSAGVVQLFVPKNSI